MNTEDIQHLQELLQKHKDRLRIRELQAANFGISCPPEVLIEIREINQKIANIEKNINSGIIQSIYSGKNIIEQIGYDIDNFDQNIKKLTRKEVSELRILGIPIYTFTKLISFMIEIFPILVGTGIISILLGMAALTGRLIPVPVLIPSPLPTIIATPTPTSTPTLTLTSTPTVTPTSKPTATARPTRTSRSISTPTNPPLAPTEPTGGQARPPGVLRATATPERCCHAGEWDGAEEVATQTPVVPWIIPVPSILAPTAGEGKLLPWWIIVTGVTLIIFGVTVILIPLIVLLSRRWHRQLGR